MPFSIAAFALVGGGFDPSAKEGEDLTPPPPSKNPEINAVQRHRSVSSMRFLWPLSYDYTTAVLPRCCPLLRVHASLLRHACGCMPFLLLSLDGARILCCTLPTQNLEENQKPIPPAWYGQKEAGETSTAEVPEGGAFLPPAAIHAAAR